MAQAPSPRRGGLVVLAAIVLVLAAVLLLAPHAIGAWIGGLVGHVWATTLAAIVALLSGLFGG